MEVRHHHSSDFTRIFDILQYQAEKYPNPNALNAMVDGRWSNYSIDTLIRYTDNLSCWLIRNGYDRNDRVILMPVMGSPEWIIIDLACQQCGIVTIPVHVTSTEQDLELILKESETRLCICASVEVNTKVHAANQRLGGHVKVFHLDSTQEGYFHWQVSEPASEEHTHLQKIKNSISEEDEVTMLYTSGSSGIPKGVPLTHKNIVHNIKSILPMLPLEPQHRVLSFLPFSHILERMACYGYLAFGVSVYFSQRKETFAHDFNSVKPYFCTCVPRVLEKMYDYMQAQLMDKNMLKRKLIAWAFEIGMKYQSEGHKPFFFSVQLFFARVLVLSQWRKKLGGKIRYMVVGAASLRPEIGRLFSAAGIHIVEGYGMTETAPLISINRFEPGQNRFGTVGLVISGTEIKIDQPDAQGQGEILVKGPQVMKGYYQRPDLNREVFTPEGWFRTGDVGRFINGRFLQITDRKKDIFKTSAGVYIAPQPLQSHFAKSLFIQRCLIIGFQRPFVTALIVPNFEVLQAWCKQEHIHWTSPQFMVHNIKVLARLQHEIDTLNEALANVERVRRFVLCPQDWTVESGELTTSLKPIRQRIVANYQNEIEKMYA